MSREIRVLHIMPDEKFIDYFIDQSEEVSPGAVDYLVQLRHGKDDFVYVKSDRVRKIKWNSRIRYKDLEKPYSRIVLHGFYPPDMLKFVQSAPDSVQFFWMFLGGEGYKFTYSGNAWFLPETKKLVRDLLKEETDFLRSRYRLCLNWYQRKIDAFQTRKMIGRMDTCCTWVEEDYHMIQFLQPKLNFLPYAYFTYEQLGLDNKFSGEVNFDSIWLGNSATATNNHMDAFMELKQMNWSGDIVVPLSYGSEAYKEKILQEGEKMFGHRFQPITTFLPLQEYHAKMQQSGIVFMNHLRQQAAGNVLAALAMGRLVLLHPQSNLYKTLKNWGVHFLEKNQLGNLSAIDRSQFQQNRHIIQEQMSKKKSIESVRTINLL